MKFLLKDTYLAMIRNSVGSNLFRTLYAEVDGKKEDILRDGDVSCAYFVSSILYHFKLLKEVHATVSGTTRDMEASGWTTTDKPVPGAVVLWEKIKQRDEEMHEHNGFVLNEKTAVSSRFEYRIPIEHPLHYAAQAEGNPVRKVAAIYIHPFLTS